VPADASQVLLEVAGDLGDVVGLIVGRRRICDGLEQFFEQFIGRLGEVLDEVQRVADLVGDAGSHLAEGGQLLVGHDLVLRAVQVGQRLGELRVALAQLARQLFDQVQSLHLQRGLAELLERVRHLGHLVAATGLDRRLEVAAGQGPHAVRQPGDATQDPSPDEQPAERERAHDAGDADHDEQHAAGADSPRRRRSGGVHAGLHRADERLDLVDQAHAQRLVLGQQGALVLGDLQGAEHHVEHPAVAEAELDQPAHRRTQVVCGRFVQCREVDLDAVPSRFEALSERLDQRGVRCAERAREQRVGLRHVAAQRRPAAVGQHLGL